MSDKGFRTEAESNVAIPMRDGTILRADIIRPAASGRFPVVLQRIPYDKRRPATSFIPETAASRGYVVINQDVRGRFASAGEYAPYQDDLQDGYDTVEWAAAQPWSDGKVGMFGGSYMGATQLLAAASRPPHLVCLFPCITGADHYDGWVYQSGAFNISSRLSWIFLMAADTAQRKGISLPANIQAILIEMSRTLEIMLTGDTVALMAHNRRIGEMLDPWYRQLPLKSIPIPREVADYYFDWIEHSTAGPYWDRFNATHNYTAMGTPAFHIGGWYDLFSRGPLTNFNGLRENATTAEGRKGQRIIMGPWIHGNYTSQVGEMNFGPNATLSPTEMTELHLSWYDYWLKGVPNGVLDGPPVRLFVMGKNAWRDENEWPLARTRYVRYYARSEGSANSASGDGRLSPLAPGDEPADTYVYDPADPVPTMGGNFLPTGSIAGVRDQRPVESRQDVLVYTGDVLPEDLEVTGPLAVELWASSSARDTDFTAKLVDVHPNGFAQNIQDGIMRARFRESLHEPRLMQPGEVLQYRINLSVTSNVFLAGHRIRLEISSSNFPHYDRNPNTGHNFGEDAEVQVARQTVFHDHNHPTCIILPIV